MNAGEIALDRREYMRSYNGSSKKWQQGIEDGGGMGNRNQNNSLVNRNCDTVVCRRVALPKPISSA